MATEGASWSFFGIEVKETLVHAAEEIVIENRKMITMKIAIRCADNFLLFLVHIIKSYLLPLF